MGKAASIGYAACLGLAAALAWPSAATLAASFDCSALNLTRAEALICQDAQLSRSDEQTARRIRGMSRRLGFGPYLGLRYWHSGWREQRTFCGTDRGCLAASYRAQGRFLDRLQQCLDGGQQRRSCLRNTLSGEREAVRR